QSDQSPINSGKTGCITMLQHLYIPLPGRLVRVLAMLPVIGLTNTSVWEEELALKQMNLARAVISYPFSPRFAAFCCPKKSHPIMPSRRDMVQPYAMKNSVLSELKADSTSVPKSVSDSVEVAL